MSSKTIPIQQITAGGMREAALLRDGWRKQTTIGEPRLSELAENYRDLGYEVLVERYRADGDGCNTCFEAGDAMGQFNGTIYLRERTDSSAAKDDDLF
ncbi:MAG: hypothetical protein D4S02_00665 [Rhodocyclaceae bacterium]|nr:MAG: hypothetical protein D4S02_00665 [Rhodocyclaceae bacterium]